MLSFRIFSKRSHGQERIIFLSHQSLRTPRSKTKTSGSVTCLKNRMIQDARPFYILLSSTKRSSTTLPQVKLSLRKWFYLVHIASTVAFMTPQTSRDVISGILYGISSSFLVSNIPQEYHVKLRRRKILQTSVSLMTLKNPLHPSSSITTTRHLIDYTSSWSSTPFSMWIW